MDSIESRLKQFIQMEGISPASFADSLGMQRSGLSHLINGRNKPSYDFISKMLATYPELNADWLILGKGKPYKNSSHNDELPEPPQNEPPMGGLFSNPQPEDNAIFPGQYAESQMNEEAQPIPEPLENPILEAAPTVDRQIPQPAARKSISKIIIFYSDGSYEER